MASALYYTSSNSVKLERETAALADCKSRLLILVDKLINLLDLVEKNSAMKSHTAGFLLCLVDLVCSFQIISLSGLITFCFLFLKIPAIGIGRHTICRPVCVDGRIHPPI